MSDQFVWSSATGRCRLIATQRGVRVWLEDQARETDASEALSESEMAALASCLTARLAASLQGR